MGKEKNGSLKKMLHVFSVTVKHFFPSIEKYFRQVSDPRQEKKTDYPLRDIFYGQGFFFFAFDLGHEGNYMSG